MLLPGKQNPIHVHEFVCRKYQQDYTAPNSIQTHFKPKPKYLLPTLHTDRCETPATVCGRPAPVVVVRGARRLKAWALGTEPVVRASVQSRAVLEVVLRLFARLTGMMKLTDKWNEPANEAVNTAFGCVCVCAFVAHEHLCRENKGHQTT